MDKKPTQIHPYGFIFLIIALMILKDLKQYENYILCDF